MNGVHTGDEIDMNGAVRLSFVLLLPLPFGIFREATGYSRELDKERHHADNGARDDQPWFCSEPPVEKVAGHHVEKHGAGELYAEAEERGRPAEVRLPGDLPTSRLFLISY